ncbi:gag-polyprotein putative aspartyl protease [Fragilaria crotonensis]|nr:gag-polyprotein putative aspartyl protease [Fragilaria crotonensis]
MESGRTIPAFNLETIQQFRFELKIASIVPKYNLKSYGTSATMTGAAGTVTQRGLSQINWFNFGGEKFESMLAAVQETDVLSIALDGIIGLSFLQQFACVELNDRLG